MFVCSHSSARASRSLTLSRRAQSSAIHLRSRAGACFNPSPSPPPSPPSMISFLLQIVGSFQKLLFVEFSFIHRQPNPEIRTCSICSCPASALSPLLRSSSKCSAQNPIVINSHTILFNPPRPSRGDCSPGRSAGGFYCFFCNRTICCNPIPFISLLLPLVTAKRCRCISTRHPTPLLLHFHFLDICIPLSPYMHPNASSRRHPHHHHTPLSLAQFLFTASRSARKHYRHQQTPNQSRKRVHISPRELPLTAHPNPPHAVSCSHPPAMKVLEKTKGDWVLG
jgi:hypothetical protein